jgi:hypothetical protein
MLRLVLAEIVRIGEEGRAASGSGLEGMVSPGHSNVSQRTKRKEAAPHDALMHDATRRQ